MENDAVMSWKEIEETFDSEWVLIEDPELSLSLEVLGGKVAFHSTDKNDVYQKMKDLPQLNHAIRYIGKLPENVVYAL